MKKFFNKISNWIQDGGVVYLILVCLVVIILQLALSNPEYKLGVTKGKRELAKEIYNSKAGTEKEIALKVLLGK